jgi:hypothetical protein
MPEVPVTVANRVTNERLKPVMLQNPSTLKILTAILSAMAVLVPILPPHTIAAKILTGAVGIGGALGLVSSGIRKQE